MPVLHGLGGLRLVWSMRVIVYSGVPVINLRQTNTLSRLGALFTSLLPSLLVYCGTDLLYWAHRAHHLLAMGKEHDAEMGHAPAAPHLSMDLFQPSFHSV